MRKQLAQTLIRALKPWLAGPRATSHPLPLFFTPYRSLAQVHPDRPINPPASLTATSPSQIPDTPPDPHHQPPDERTINLGKTLHILRPHLPTLLTQPLPPSILSPHITLHLFPTTHPHLPTITGRVAYHAALWSSPIAWGRLPLISNLKLDILSERMVDAPSSSTPASSSGSPTAHGGSGEEKLIVRWRTCGKTRGLGMGAGFRGIRAGERVDKITEWLGGEVRDDEEFEGRFEFGFDEGGRVLVHTIECAEVEGGGEVGGGVGEWLLGRVGGRGEVLVGFVGGRRGREV